MDLSGKVSIVTGGAQGIGKNFSTRLLELGAKVCIADINENAGNAAKQELSQKYKEKVIFQKCDVTDYKSFESAVQNTISAFGKLDILVNNAGIANEQKWKDMIQINIVGVIHGIQLAFEYMGKDKGKNGGCVINTASDAGLRSYYMIPVYTGTKHAVVGLTKCFGFMHHFGWDPTCWKGLQVWNDDYYYKKHGVTVNSICPGPVDTELMKNISHTSLDREGSLELIKTLSIVSPTTVAEALETLLRDGGNGTLLRILHDGTFRYVEYE